MDKSNKLNQPGPGKGPHNINRRRFLKDAGLMAGGVAITSMFVSSACSSGNAAPTSSTGPTTTTTGPTTPTSTAPTTTSSTPPATTSGGGEYEYHPVMDYNLLDIEGCTSRVADDRLYDDEHTWAKQLEPDVVVIGITDKMALLTDIIKSIDLKSEGAVLRQDDSFGYAHGAKMSVELVSPVSGTIIRKNNALHEEPYGYAEVINKWPYDNGWLLIIRLSDPSELDGLLTPEEYAIQNRKET
jgi:glycine cleavage system H protein